MKRILCIVLCMLPAVSLLVGLLLCMKVSRALYGVLALTFASWMLTEVARDERR